MNQTHQLELQGCAPEPLMAYLKALGVFRVVAEQEDADARCWWCNDTFVVRSTLDRHALQEFLLKRYRPTPILSPWNGGSGFHPRDNSKAMELILGLESPRFHLWSEVIAIGRRIVSRSEGTDKKKPKEWILARCRAEFPADALAWLDSAYVLTAEGSRFPPLLGTGGNDGRLEFSNNFMQNVVLALNLDERHNGGAIARSQVEAALFGGGSPGLVRKKSSGFYNPGGLGGANASVGFNDGALTNPWDYVLMFEGILMFAGAVARRLSPQASPKAVFPFTVDSSAAGYGTSVDSEYGNSSRAEFWAPLWNQPTCRMELTHLMSEGRVQLGRRQGSNGSDVARALTGLGTDRGVTQFQRYGFMARNGFAHLAVPLGRFRTLGDEGSKRAKAANVLFDLDGWLGELRRNASGSRAPSGLGTVLARIEGAIIEFCQRGEPHDLQEVLIAVGQAERWLACSGLRERVRPLDNLSREWLFQADDGSTEFRLARAMASILPETVRGQRRMGPIRENLEPVDTAGETSWIDDNASFVWTANSALTGMLAVLERRCLEGRMTGIQCEGNLPLNAAFSSRLTEVVAFLEGSVDAQRIAKLALPLSFLQYRARREGEQCQRENPPSAPFDLPTAYATMKLTLLPGKLACPEFGANEGIDIAMEPSMLAMLRAGRVNDAYQAAHSRLKASGLRPLSDDSGIRDRSEQGRRLAAALLFPLDSSMYVGLAERALRRADTLEAERI